MLNVLNTQVPEPSNRHPEGVVQVHSIFPTIQGEGPFTGHAALFVRLSGCNLQCPGCDTEYTSNRFLWDPLLLTSHIAALTDRGDLIVITGGEPFRQNITPLVKELLNWKFRVQVETNGTFFDPNFPYLHCNGEQRMITGGGATVIVSPKTAKIHPETAEMASAYKYVIRAGHVDEDGLPTDALYNVAGLGKRTRVARPPEGWEGPIYVNPMDEQDEYANRANLQACVNSVIQHKRYILGIQMQKHINRP